MGKLLFLCLCVLGRWAVVDGNSRLQEVGGSETSPAAYSCGSSGSSVHLIGCLDFLEDGPLSRLLPPTSPCCSGVRSTMQVNPQCFCEAVQNMGVPLDLTRASELPTACAISASISCSRTPPQPPPPTPTPSPRPSLQQPASPPPDCDYVVFDLLPCDSYLKIGSTISKPDADCCNGVKQVLNGNPACVCSSVSLAPIYSLDVQRIDGLPAACGISYTANCPGSPTPSPPTTPPAPIVPPHHRGILRGLVDFL
ncbi:hypothetical protein ACLOJK_016180 [Asimina triloba]